MNRFTAANKTKHKQEMKEAPYSRTAQTGVDPVSFADSLVVWGHVVEAGVEVKHEEEITDGTNHSDRGGNKSIYLVQIQN